MGLKFPPILIIIGFVIFLTGFFKTPNYLKPQQTQAGKEQVASEPSHIRISKIGVDADIVRGGIINGEWILSDNEILYLPTSGELGEGFNTVLYGHKRPGLFADLINLTEGDLIEVSDNQDDKFTYEVYLKEEIEPRQTGKLISIQRDDLTMFTCDGVFDESRLLVRAKFVSSKNS
ncbi:hypothetical protein A3C26_01760 [Candidatus Daviesbacteria bacterium RIFCSPHIGHO2_02_FULL_39_12]|uniref:Sortase n=2 Tax=Candidatus Daviesiibacteriota TaxID=1752718 RepID=A0A1F5JAX3_9BACT|nr:MAG: hypothetical protein A3C26_01760 [Candidatus Daviesbacteria bacterium RIFCSPHIGHO2_02_FULL_39_12]OGE72700.1 MAG: hypothetical protein A3H40_00085 [Candidatus Daviesbacteria bacterium RIFCSPLOWO2_02_FULL_38_15]